MLHLSENMGVPAGVTNLKPRCCETTRKPPIIKVYMSSFSEGKSSLGKL